MPNITQDSFSPFTPQLLPPNLGAVSDEHGERFHQDITKMQQSRQMEPQYDGTLQLDALA